MRLVITWNEPAGTLLPFSEMLKKSKLSGGLDGQASPPPAFQDTNDVTFDFPKGLSEHWVCSLAGGHSFLLVSLLSNLVQIHPFLLTCIDKRDY